MASYEYGKADVVHYIVQLAKQKSEFDEFRILDVGTCDGKWSDLLNPVFEADGLPTLVLDGCEAFKPNAARCLYKYHNMFVGPICDYKYDIGQYDVIIFGDVIEHMEVGIAQYVLDYAVHRANEVIVGVPYEYPQGEIYGNPYEKHIQDDLTHELFLKRYFMCNLERFLHPVGDYGYYRKVR